MSNSTTPGSMDSLVRRKLGLVENYHYQRNRQNLYTVVVSCGVYSEPLTEDQVVNALVALAAKHPIFYHCVTLDENASNSPCLVLNPNLDLRRFVDFSTLKDFLPDGEKYSGKDLSVAEESYVVQSMIEKAEMDKIDFLPNCPQWRVTVVDNRYVVFAGDHMLFDGSAVKNFQVLLAEEIVKQRSGNVAQDSKTLDGPQSLVEPVESAVDLKIKPTMLAGALIQDMPIVNWMVGKCSKVYSTFIKKRTPLEESGLRLEGKIVDLVDGSSSGKYPNLHTLHRCVKLDEEQTKRLMLLCKEHDVKLTSLFTYAGLLTVSTVVSSLKAEMGRDFPGDYNLQIPINLRRFLSPEKAAASMFGNMASGAEFALPSLPPFNPSTGHNWLYVQAIHQNLWKSVTNGDVQSLLGLLKLVDAEKYVGTVKKKGFSNFTVQVSNVGNAPVKFDKTNLLKDVWFSQCSGYIGSALDLNIVGLRGEIQMVLGIDENHLLGGHMDQVREQFIAILDDLVSRSPSLQ